MADSFRKYSHLEHLSVERLEELLDLAVNTDDDENSEYVDAILEVIVKKERSNPTGRIRDVDEAWADFQTYYNTEDGRGQTLYYSEEQGETVVIMPGKRRTLREIRKVALTTAAVVVCLFASIIVAQAAGFDVLGVLARWTDGVFAFGEIQPETVDIPSEGSENYHTEVSARRAPSIKTSEELSYSTFQEALNAYEITEVSEPSKLPDGYVLEQVYGLDAVNLTLDAVYTDGVDFMSVSINTHNGNPSIQVEKTDEPVDIFEVGNTTFYLMKNTNNYTVVWLTEHYECSIIAPLSIESVILKEIVYSMFD